MTRTEPALKWDELPDPVRVALARKLQGLYGGLTDETVFDALAVDKQQALLILLRRFRDLDLWNAVRNIQNLYGENGVGMSFGAWPYLRSTLARRSNFTSWFATHRDTNGGFLERGQGRASLHFLFAGDGSSRRWEAHFDLYNPLSSPVNAWRHLLHEKINRRTPDWRIILASLGYGTPGLDSFSRNA